MKKDYRDINIAAVVYALRKWKKLPQLYFADTLHIDRTNYGRMESGETVISGVRLKEIADLLGVSIAAIHTFADSIVHIDFKTMSISRMLDLFESGNAAEKDNFTAEELHIIYSYIKAYFGNKATPHP
ncbi:MAG: helix-turn-helix transcriptional regulator [Bacteroidetes bacterium]|nr:helix-turn-helix transcriptional regulator [Bacteroidota bacterium]